MYAILILMAHRNKKKCTLLFFNYIKYVDIFLAECLENEMQHISTIVKNYYSFTNNFRII